MVAASPSSRRTWMALWALSGFGTLSLEMVWMREMALWSGSTVTAAALVTAVFFASAAAGNLRGSRLMRQQRAPLRCYARNELMSAGCAMLCLVLGRSLWAGISVLPEGWWLRAGMALLLAGPASFFSGVAFPSLAQAFVKSPHERVASGASFYAMNLLGASAGVVVGGVLLPWWLGIQNTLFVAASAQLVGGAVAWRMACRLPMETSTAKSASPDDQQVRGWVCLLASGTLSLAAQALMLLWVRQVLEGSLYAMSAVLAVFVAGLGLGALTVAALRRRGRSLLGLLRGCAGLGAVGLFLLPWIGTHLSTKDVLLTATTPAGLTVQALGMCMVVLLPITGCLGGVFPLAWELSGPSFRGEGRVLGYALALNKLGAAMGMMLGLFVLLPLAGLGCATCVVAWGYAAIAFSTSRPNWRWRGFLVLVGLALTFASSPPPGISPDSKLIASKSGAYGPVSVIEDWRTGSRQILLNSRQRLSGTQRALASQRHQSWVPLLLCQRPQRVCTIGMAAGISADAALDFPIARLDAVELVPEVVEAARNHFAEWNGRLFVDPRAQVITDDGRQVLARSSQTYDAIICDLFFPAEEGTAHLYSREFFQLCRSRLCDEGVFCLWLPCYQHNAASADMIVRTFLKVFPHALMVRASLDPLQPVIGLVGSAKKLTVSAAALEERLDSAGLRGRSPFLRSGVHAQMLLVGDLRAADPGFDHGDLITDDRPLMAWMGPGMAVTKEALQGVRLLDWAGRRFPQSKFPSCELGETLPEDLLLAIRAANHYLAAAVSATVLATDPRPEEVRRQQTFQALERARGLSPVHALDLEDLGH